jgi:four helix bundle protein
MAHPSTELKERTKTFALGIIKLIHALPPGPESRVISHQLLRSATSVAANYRVVCRARSRSEFLAKLGVVIEEADESAFWMELICDASLLPTSRVENLRSEANQLLAIFNASRTTARKGLRSKGNRETT